MSKRNTPTKRAVMKVLSEADTALSHDMIQDQLEDIDRATIYRILNRFHTEGLTHKIIGEDGKQYFALCTECEEHQHNHDHFHFQCTKCGKVECLDQEISFNLPKGYTYKNFRGLVTGICSECS